MTNPSVPYESNPAELVQPVIPEIERYEAPDAISISPVVELQTSRTLGRKALVGATVVGMYAWSHFNYLAEIGGGEMAVHQYGVNPWAAAGAVAAIAATESLGASYVATKGIGDFTIEPSNKFTKALAASAVLSPIQSLWSGAPAGVMTDKMFHREVTLKRRLVHAVPYGLAVGMWVTPNPVSETVVESVGSAVNFGEHEVVNHPATSSVVLGSVALAATALKLRASRKQAKNRAA